MMYNLIHVLALRSVYNCYPCICLLIFHFFSFFYKTTLSIIPKVSIKMILTCVTGRIYLFLRLAYMFDVIEVF